MIYTAQLLQLPLINRRTGDVWFLVAVSDEDAGDEEVVFQSRPRDGRAYLAGSAELSDVLMAAIGAVAKDLEHRFPPERVTEAFETQEHVAGVEVLETASISFRIAVDSSEVT